MKQVKAISSNLKQNISITNISLAITNYCQQTSENITVEDKDNFVILFLKKMVSQITELFLFNCFIFEVFLQLF